MAQTLHLVTGKGGVGKTTVAAALALAHVRAGRRTLLCEMGGGGRLPALLGVQPVGYAMREVHENLTLIDITPQEALREYVLLIIRIEALYKAVFESRVVSAFLRLLPALGELTMLGKIWYELQQRQGRRLRFQTIVVDMPATGHAQALLEAPLAVSKSIPGGPMRDNAERLDAMIKAEGCQLHVVATPEEMPLTEARELMAMARAIRVPLAPLIINQRLAPLPEAALAAVQPWRTHAALGALPAALEAREARRQRGERLIAALGADGAAARSLPYVHGHALDVATLERLGERLMQGDGEVQP